MHVGYLCTGTEMLQWGRRISRLLTAVSVRDTVQLKSNSTEVQIRRGIIEYPTDVDGPIINPIVTQRARVTSKLLGWAS